MAAVDRYRAQPFWRHKPLTPAQLLVQDVGLESLQSGRPPRLELREVTSANLGLDDLSRKSVTEQKGNARTILPTPKLGSTWAEHQTLAALEDNYGWISRLRLKADQENTSCRWIHISSKFPEYLRGVLLGLSDWTDRPDENVDHLRHLDRCLYESERFSKHGKYFSPFCQPLTNAQPPPSDGGRPPLLLSIPFLDWTQYPGPLPPLRFNIDPRDPHGQRGPSSKSSFHPTRSLLQHYYRLEDTTDRDRTQVFSRHRPWYGDKDIDLKVRRWYGQYPTGMIVDEMWLLVVDDRHIVTFSSNQTWKARWPPLQLASRISDVSFRRIRDDYYNSERGPDYTAFTHAIACVHAAVGMMHRGFWTDMPLPCTDRYGGYLSHLQFRLHRAPNTKLVRDLLQIQDELTIVLQLTKDQEAVIIALQKLIGTALTPVGPIEKNVDDRRRASSTASTSDTEAPTHPPPWHPPRHNLSPIVGDGNTLQSSVVPHLQSSDEYTVPTTAAFRLQYSFRPTNPLTEILDLLHHEHDDLASLRQNSNELATRTVQLVNIRLEDHGRAVLVFTLVTVIFLPLSFVSSYYGMNLRDVKDTNDTQGVFWTWGLVTTITVLAFSSVVAFWGGAIRERFELMLERRGWGGQAV